jgi:outer membrane protein OmpA-like peptidoglycan-associated protein
MFSRPTKASAMLKHLLLVAALSAAPFAPAAAQTADSSALSSQEIVKRFEEQKTRSLTRSLRIAPGGQSGGTASTSQPAAAPAETYVRAEQGSELFLNISFDFDSAALRADQKPNLSNMCAAMKTADVATFQIIGHTDSTGTAAYNERLSLLRAEEVKRYLVEECGIPPAKLQTVGVGSQFPADTANPKGDVNRRVEFQALS